MNKLILIVSTGLILFFVSSAMAQGQNQGNQSLVEKATQKKASDLGQKEAGLVDQPPLELGKQGKNSKDNDLLYHIVITSKGKKSQSLWVELEDGEQRFITIKLDNAEKKGVSIQLDEKVPSPIRPIYSNNPIYSQRRLNQLTLQPISF